MTKHTTTQHIEALLVKDGREFAMVRKADLRALLDIAKADPHQGRYLDRHGEYERKLAENREVIDECFAALERNARNARKHGDERRRYMANNKALLARIDQQDFAFSGLRAHWEQQREQLFERISTIIEMTGREADLEARLRRIGRFKLKNPAIGALMDLTP